MLRTPLEELVLQIKILKLGPAEMFLQKAIQSPETKAVSDAVRCLKDLVSATIISTNDVLNRPTSYKLLCIDQCVT